jgi:hypothetical protein
MNRPCELQLVARPTVAHTGGYLFINCSGLPLLVSRARLVAASRCLSRLSIDQAALIQASRSTHRDFQNELEVFVVLTTVTVTVVARSGRSRSD